MPVPPSLPPQKQKTYHTRPQNEHGTSQRSNTTPTNSITLACTSLTSYLSTSHRSYDQQGPSGAGGA